MWVYEGGNGTMTPDELGEEHDLLVAFRVRGSTRDHAEIRLTAMMPTPNGILTEWHVSKAEAVTLSDQDWDDIVQALLDQSESQAATYPADARRLVLLTSRLVASIEKARATNTHNEGATDGPE